LTLPGSSIMPGKVNLQSWKRSTKMAFEVIGNDLALTMAAEGATAAQRHGAADRLQDFDSIRFA
jgi:aspartate ammonia-lyase